MPEWIHQRAEHLLAKNPDMKKSTAFAVATQQSHALGKTPKGYGTSKGRQEAKAKYDTPKDDVKAANPGDLKTPKLGGVFVEKEASDRMKLAFAKMAAPTQSEIETKGSLENNVADTIRGTEHSQQGAGEQKGVPTEGYHWGQDPKNGQPRVGVRSSEYETFTDGAEEINVTDGPELLRRIFTNMEPAADAAKSTIEQNFAHGRRGSYVTHSQTLLEQVRRVAGRA